MAEMMPGRTADRGQMILVAGIVLAVLFVALALLVNAAIYTDNVATRGGDSAGEALEYQAGVVDSVGGLIDAENADGNPDNIEGAISEIDETNRQLHLRRGAQTGLTDIGEEDGLLLRESGVDGFEDWQANASAVRGFIIEFDTGNMSDSDPPLVIDLDGEELKVNKTANDELTIKGGTNSIDETVEFENEETVRFDVTGERIGDAPVRFGWPASGSVREIRIEDGENGGGSYELTVESSDNTEDFPEAVEVTDAVYSVDLDLRIDTADLSYERTVRVAPGEPDV